MRLRQSRVPALIFLLPALQVLATSISKADSEPAARAVAAPPAYADVSAAPDPSLAPTTGTKGTKNAPFDGQDGMPHEGPYVKDDPVPSNKKPAIVEDLGPKKTVAGPPKASSTVEVLDGDKSVMQDPDRKLATGNKGTEGGVSAKDKERLAHEEKTGEKLEKIPESPKEAPPLPHSEQKQLHGEVLEGETSTRALGAVGLEVSCRLSLVSCGTYKSVETNQSSRESARYSPPQARLIVRQGPSGHHPKDEHSRFEPARRRCRRCHPALSFLHTSVHNDYLLGDWRQNIPCGCVNGHAAPPTARLLRRFLRAHRYDRAFRRSRTRSTCSSL